eukprot:symbB.v1.2.018842.t1/scaffold1518.1/size114122/7
MALIRLEESEGLIREASEQDGWTTFARFSGALWETFVDVATSRSPRERKGWEYRKGIEGMSMGSMAYEMLTVSEDTKDFRELQKEYEAGYGVPFLNLSARKLTAMTRDVPPPAAPESSYSTWEVVLLGKFEATNCSRHIRSSWHKKESICSTRSGRELTGSRTGLSSRHFRMSGADEELPDFDEGEDQKEEKDKDNGDAKKASQAGMHASGFKDFLLKPELLRAIVDCGFEHPSEVQHECIPQAILGTDVLCQAKSGMGKTAVFVLACLQQIDASEKAGNHGT